MPEVTKLSPLKRRPSMCSVHLDGRFAFVLSLAVVGQMGLRQGDEISLERIEALKAGQIRQKAMDDALRVLSGRGQSRAQLRSKLAKKQHPGDVIESVMARLEELGYINDAKFAETRATAAAKTKKLGRRRAAQDLIKAGVERGTAARALEEVYEAHDSAKVARELVEKHLPRLSRFDVQTTRRRLMGVLMRKGYDYEMSRNAISEVMGRGDEMAEEL